ncbi:unnamed protein product [Mucor hiemalis]
MSDKSETSKKRGRRFGGSNPNGGRKKKHIEGQSKLTSFVSKKTNTNSCDVGVQTDWSFFEPGSEVVEAAPAEVEMMSSDDLTTIVEDEDMAEVGNSANLENTLVSENTSAIESTTAAENPFPVNLSNNEQSIDPVEDDIQAEEIGSEELDENQFFDVDEQLGSVEEGSVVDNYLKSIQERLRGGSMPSEYKNGTFWVHVKSPSFILGGPLSTQPFFIYREFFFGFPII